MSETSASLQQAVSIDAIRAAREIVYQHITPTPLLEYPLLSEEIGARVFVKHENHLPTGAFKIRGGLNFMHHFAAARTHSGVITATRGNHGQSVALAARLHGIPATIVIPFGNNPEKNAAMQAFGARLVEHGRDFDEAREETARLAEAENLRYVHSFNEPQIVNGVGTYALEIIEAFERRGERIDAIFVPIGMGSGLCGVISAFRALSPETKIYGVQAEGAPSYYLSWQAGKVVETKHAHTFADGVATRVPAPMALDIINRGPGEGVDEILLVSDSEIIRAIRLLWRTTHNLAEGAGAAATAATIKLGEQLRGQNVVNVMSGANLDTTTLREIFSN
ncbi:MAG TPA: threonine dehydratase [Blastocatellia bacterium]|nr:threonine dehydratase [Blastocatellia bacterium]